MKQMAIQTEEHAQFVDITRVVQNAVAAEGLREGLVHVYVPHTTAGVTINEHADPDVVRDMIRKLDRMVEWNDPDFRHGEGNSAAHVKASLMGSSVAVPVSGGRLQLGTCQGIFFCEFDGPRHRQIYISFTK